MITFIQALLQVCLPVGANMDSDEVSLFKIDDVRLAYTFSSIKRASKTGLDLEIQNTGEVYGVLSFLFTKNDILIEVANCETKWFRLCENSEPYKYLGISGAFDSSI